MALTERAWVEIDLKILEENFFNLQNLVGAGVKVVPVIKANAYGHGVLEIADKLVSMRVDMLALATLSEAILVRQSGINVPILILGGCPDGQELLAVTNDIMPAIFTEKSLARLSKAAIKLRKTIKYHIKIDTGLGRVGIQPDELLNFLERGQALNGVVLEGIFSHFSVADEPEQKEFTEGQLELFNQTIKKAESAGFDIKYKHIANSAGTIFHPDSWLDLVRTGISLYGVNPSSQLGTSLIKPVLSLKTRVLLLKTLPKGRSIGYGRIFSTSRNTTVATIGIGYGDGVSRLLSNKGKVIIRGQYAPIIGNISMDLITIDVTGIPSVSINDEVIIIGNDGESKITARDIGNLIGTIPYEVLTSIGSRVERVYLS